MSVTKDRVCRLVPHVEVKQIIQFQHWHNWNLQDEHTLAGLFFLHCGGFFFSKKSGFATWLHCVGGRYLHFYYSKCLGELFPGILHYAYWQCAWLVCQHWWPTVLRSYGKVCGQSSLLVLPWSDSKANLEVHCVPRLASPLGNRVYSCACSPYSCTAYTLRPFGASVAWRVAAGCSCW